MAESEGFRSVAYFVNWAIYGRKHNPQDIPAEKLTHVLYSFADVRDTGEVFLTDKWSDTDIHFPPGDSWNDIGTNLYGCLKQFNLLKKRNRNLKVLLSIGGWTYSEAKHFDVPASTHDGRKRFAASCVDLIKDLGFDGIDIDWEYPSNSVQAEHLFLLLAEVRQAMDTYAATLPSRPHFLLTIAAPAGPQNYGHLPLGRIAETLDFINLMAYDYAGGWDAHAGHQANLYPSSNPKHTPFSTSRAVSDYLAAGVPSSKLVLGMPLYGRAFQGTKGPGHHFSNGVGGGSFENGIWDFKDLPKAGAREFLDESVGASWSFDEGMGAMVSYDTVDMAVRKAGFIKEWKLGGAMWWETSGDRKGEGSLIGSVVRELGGHDGRFMQHSPNVLEYPQSKYDNLRKGFPGE
ncbi:glycoside hydrolase family 18 protein [Lepidopterella palustris CBS 459.81]|uniref:chitinase n=1 Tax=Lepidopterella palustris CBS 459.81 TaxID=1314670 RepID=A0A8E2J9X1_9PEZI|nr:glycoside hydrolase family 18 protein [Lepidopterella palustris CBS 459.81]